MVYVTVSIRDPEVMHCGRTRASGATTLANGLTAFVRLHRRPRSASNSSRHALNRVVNADRGLMPIHLVVSRALIARTRAYRRAVRLAGVDKHAINCVVAVASNCAVNL